MRVSGLRIKAWGFGFAVQDLGLLMQNMSALAPSQPKKNC